jgi:hypothetical protein
LILKIDKDLDVKKIEDTDNKNFGCNRFELTLALKVN